MQLRNQTLLLLMTGLIGIAITPAQASAWMTDDSACLTPEVGTFKQLPSQLLAEVQDLLPERQTIFTRNPQFIDESINPNLIMSRQSTVKITFIDEGAGYRNAFGYVLFDPNETVICEQSIWANASEQGGGGSLVPGDTVNLGTFPPGTRMGFYVIANGFRRGESVPSQANPNNVFYSIDRYNTDGYRHVALIGTQTEVDGIKPFILGFEDLRNLGDKDYNDAVFMVEITPDESREDVIENGNLPISDYSEDDDNDGIDNGEDDFPNDPNRATIVRLPGADQNYFLSFEDLFTDVGDGDFNDFLDAFYIEQYLNAAGQIKDIRIMHRMIARGASYTHEFHHRVRFPGAASSVTKRYSRSGVLLEEVLGSHINAADIVIFPNSHDALFDETTGSLLPNTEVGYDQKAGRYTETIITFASPISALECEEVPYDPYLLVAETGYDIHLPGRLPIEGSNNPDTATGQTFMNEAGFPFAMLVPGNWKYPLAGVYIGTAYPKFNAWLFHDGTREQDWYNFPVEGFREYTPLLPPN